MEVAAAILGVEPTATREEIAAAYKVRAMVLHPDRFNAGSKSQEAATEGMKQLNEARDFMVQNHGKPFNSTNNSSSQQNTSQPQQRRTETQPPQNQSVPEPQERQLTIEEAEEERKLLRKDQIDEELYVLKQLGKGFALRFAGLIGSLVGIMFSLVNTYGTNYWPLLGLAAFGFTGLFFLKRCFIYGGTMVETLGNIAAIKRIDRSELRQYNKFMKAREKKRK